MNRKARDKYVQTRNPFPVTSCGRRRSFQTTSTPKKLNYDKSPMKGKKDACYHKVKSRVDVWPSAYASGQLVQCREAGAANWGTKSKK